MDGDTGMSCGGAPEKPPAELPRLLVVDDEEELLQVFVEFLQSEPYQLEVARTGTEAIAKVRESKFDLVVTDLNLPGADGIMVLHEAKQADPQVEIIVLTGNASILTAVDALRHGAYDYVLKPFDLFEMDQTIRKALERRRLLAENHRFIESLQEANAELLASQEELRRHRDQLRQMVDEATLRVRTLYEVGQEITSTLDLHHTLDLILSRSLQLTGASRGALYLMDETSGRLECRVTRGVEEGTGDHQGLVRVIESVHQEVVEQKRPILSGGPDATAGSLLVVPLLQSGDLTGTVAVHSERGRSLSRDDEELLASLAAQASIAINNARVYEKIRDLERLKSEFVAVVSHEVRTPLTSIKGTLELLADARYFEVADPQKQLFDICQTNVERLEALINDILDFSKLESSRLSHNFVGTSIEKLVDSVLLNISKVAERKRIRLAKEIAGPLPEVQADELRIVQVMNNLVANAIKFSGPDKEIRIRLSARDKGVVVEIRDEGVGIAPEDLPKLFHRFRQLDSSSTRKTGGTGLGLTISKGIIEEHGGRIWVQSVVDRGSSFFFWIPVSAGVGSPAPEAKSADSPAATDPAKSR